MVAERLGLPELLGDVTPDEVVNVAPVDGRDLGGLLAHPRGNWGRQKVLKLGAQPAGQAQSYCEFYHHP